MKKLILILLIFSSCTTSKKLFEKKTNTTTTSTEIGTVKRTRKGDTVTILVPNYHYKDTTIVKRGKTSTVYVNYDKEGNAEYKSICDDIDELKEYVKEAIEEKKEEVKEKEVDRGFQTIFIIYLFLGIVVLMIINDFIKKLP